MSKETDVQKVEMIYVNLTGDRVNVISPTVVLICSPGLRSLISVYLPAFMSQVFLLGTASETGPQPGTFVLKEKKENESFHIALKIIIF